jgi:outer membrane protein assembly factor BamB
MQAGPVAYNRRTYRYVIAAAVLLILVLGFAYAATYSGIGSTSVNATSRGTGGAGPTQTSTPTDGSSASSTQGAPSSTSTSSSSSTSSSTSTSTSVSTSTPTSSSSVSVSGDWLTYHGSNSRDGYDATTSNFTSPTVEWKTAVDGDVYAEPLSFNGSVFVVTENDTVYSISVATGIVNWSFQAGTAANSTQPPYACNGGEPTIAPLIGITSTPVIDPSTSTIYVVALNSGVAFNLFAINTSTGQVRWSSPVGANGFVFTYQEQRAALTLANGLVYVAFSDYSWACGPAYGWMMGLSATGNGTQYSYQITNTSEADIWETEGASVGASGFVYIVTGNSYYNTTYNYADSVLEFTPQLSLVSYFAPSDWAYLGPADLDQGTTGATLLPGNLVFSIGKAGVGYLLNSTDLGGIGGQLASLSVCSTGAWGATAYANGVIYIPCADGIHAVSVNTGPHPSLTSLWNNTFGFSGPPIVAGGAVLALNIYSGALYALNPLTGAVISDVSLVPVNSVAHFTTPSIGGGLILFAGNDSVYGLNP